MDTRAPAVVAVVVTTGPGPDLEATLASLMAQDYDNLSILVLANGPSQDVATRVASVDPSAFVRVLPENRGFGPACNEVIGAVQGAAFYLFCHDDVRFRAGAVANLVEAAYRTNAGIVSPKFVHYDDESLLLHVGQMADRFGSVTERIEPGEIDHGQHDAERDVFVAPGGATLVRSDLFESLGGFNPALSVIGEDLDLSWRAQIAGARVLVAPSAVVAHRQSVASGLRRVTALGTRAASLQDLRRRHQLMTLLTCWSAVSLLVIVPLLLLFEAAEIAIAAAGRDADRAGAVVSSWRFVLQQRQEIRRRREFVKRLRALSDAGVRLLQLAGASRAKNFIYTLVNDGLDRARGALPTELLEHAHPQAVIRFDGTFSEDADYDELPDFADGASPFSLRRAVTRFRTQFVLVVAAGVTWLVGARNLVATHLPNVGRLAPLDSWWQNWHHFFASWSPNGVGSGAPAMPGYGLIAASGTLVFGRMGILPRATLLLAVPFGVWGVSRLLRDVVSNRARLFAAMAYLALPVGVNLVQQGRIDLLILFAGLPFLTRRVFALLNVPKFRDAPYEAPRHFGSRLWGRTRRGQIAKTSLLLAVLGAFAPVVFVIVTLQVVGLWLARGFVAEAPPLERPWQTLGQLWSSAALLLAPMAVDTVFAGRRALEIFGLPMAQWSNISFSHVVRAADGIYGGGWLSWTIPAAALAGVLLAKGDRRAFLYPVALISVLTMTLAVAVGRHLLLVFAPDVDGLLILVALTLAVMIAGAVTVLETDVTTKRLRLPQVIAGVVVLGVGLLPFPILSHASGGRYGLPITSAAEALSAYTPSSTGGYRVLWVADPRALPMAGWSVEPGLAAATTMNGGPSGNTLFNPPVSDAADVLLTSLHLASAGRTTHLGQLLAPAGVSDVVVLTASVPPLGGLQDSISLPPPSSLVIGLNHQTDLALVSRSDGLLIYRNTKFHGIVGQRATPLSPTSTSSSASSAQDWTPVLNVDTLRGEVAAGTVISGFAPAGAFALTVDGHAVPRHTALGWVPTYTTSGGKAKLVLHQFPLNGILALFTMALWFLYLFGFGGTERLAELTRRRHRGTTNDRGARG